MKGKILVLPLVGQGNCRLDLNDIRTKVLSNVTFLEKNGRQVMHIDRLKVKFKVGGIRVKLDNLFNGNPLLGQFSHRICRYRSTDLTSTLGDPDLVENHFSLTLFPCNGNFDSNEIRKFVTWYDVVVFRFRLIRSQTTRSSVSLTVTVTGFGKTQKSNLSSCRKTDFTRELGLHDLVDNVFSLNLFPYNCQFVLQATR